jgi:hypothetical protein
MKRVIQGRPTNIGGRHSGIVRAWPSPIRRLTSPRSTRAPTRSCSGWGGPERAGADALPRGGLRHAGPSVSWPASQVWRASYRRSWSAPLQPGAQVFDQAEVSLDVPENGHNVSVMPTLETIHTPSIQGVSA